MSVIKFPNKQPFYEFIEQARQIYDKGKMRSFVCVFSSDYENKKKDLDAHQVSKKSSYWFAKNTDECLGSIRLMEHAILDFVKEYHSMNREGS